MKYRELLELYKQGKLEEEKARQLECDIERHEAISEYLFEEEIPGFEEVLCREKETRQDVSVSKPRIRLVGDDTQTYDATDLKFARMIHRSIRRAFVKLGMTVVVIVIAIVLFAQLALPHIVDSMYYRPDKLISDQYQTKQFDLDMAVYTEMFVPQQHRMSTWVERDGFGKYDVLVNQTYSLNRSFVDVVGKIDKGEIIFYNHNVIQPPTGNAFAWSGSGLDITKALSEQISPYDNQIYCASGSPENAKSLIEDLDDNIMYNAFVTLDQVMEYEEFVTYISNSENKGTGVWCAAVVAEYSYDWNNVGFFYDQPSSSSTDWDNEKYPELILWYPDFSEELDMKQEANAITHFTSMLSYMNDQSKFAEMMHVDTMNYEAMKQYVEENGIKIYGYMTMADKETMLKLMEEEEVYTIYTSVAR